MSALSSSTRRYLVVGLFNTGLDVALFSVLALAVGLTPVLANVGSTAVVMTVSFFINRTWVFGSSAGGAGTFVQFISVTLFSALVVQSLVILGVIAFCTEVLPDLADGIVTPGAKIAAVATGMVFNFLGYRWVFRHQAPDADLVDHQSP